MHTTIVDIETNAIEDWRELSDLKEIHCMVLRTGDDLEVFNSQRGDIVDGLRKLSLADVVVGHNAASFDLPAIQKLYPEFKMGGMLIDTLLMSRLVWPNLREDDFSRGEDFPRNLIGSHSLKAWGHRLSEFKGNFGDTADWSEWSQEMEDYCVQDVAVTHCLWRAIEREEPSHQSVILEHEFARAIRKQERNGFRFDVASAKVLHADLLDKKADLERELQDIFPPAEVPMKLPQYWLADGLKYPTKGEAIKAGHKATTITKGPRRVKTIPFNPGSRDQISRCLMDKYGWKPKDYTPGGKPKIDETVLNSLGYEEAKPLVTYLTISKRLGQLSDGKEAWLKCVEDGRIHGRVNTNGTVSGRCSHSRPNLAQTVASHSLYGKEFRSLFLPEEGHLLVGCDASGLELRMLAHYFAFWDNGEYAKAVCEGDIHTTNQEAAGLDTRDEAKRFIYAFIYGGSDRLIGEIVGGNSRDGKEVKNRFLSKIPALKKLKHLVDRHVSTRGYLIGLDKRKLPVRSKHSALNLVLQSAGAVVMKQATVHLHEDLWDFPQGSVRQVAHIHDEIQLSAQADIADAVGQMAASCIRLAGETLELKCPLAGEYRVGKNWCETH